MAQADLSKLTLNKSAPQAAVASRRKKRLLKWIVIALVAAVAVGALFARRATAPTEVEMGSVTTAFPTQGFTLLNATGRVVAAKKAAVSTKATGRLEFLGVQEGSKVKAGEVIARLEALDVNATKDQARAGGTAARANLEQGRAELVDAEAQFKRQQELFEKKFVSAAVLDAAKARMDRAKATIASLNAAIGVADAQTRAAGVSVSQTLIRAPFDGVILTKNANVGDIITPFSSAAGSIGAVVTMADMSTLEVESDVAEGSIGKIVVGAPAEITLEALPEARLLGEVSRIVPTVDRAKATVLVKVSFVERDPRILPDMSAKVAFLKQKPTDADRKPVTVVRKESIVERDGKSFVFVVNDKTVKLSPVTKSREIGDTVEVAGVKSGDKVVLKPNEKLQDGAAVVASTKK
ncbi:MAG: efflux RND transporter periplasmic adaptor subunit [Betaproteobacteria bacterium]|nr:MAG: efflux RND transporter periplasmic adaptor subunit [Betaproteobacteria bacterium]TAG45343.1 MAG: efflux RND transporter periplasmic adaptor subunit [Betaproteobacteria bacterium]